MTWNPSTTLLGTHAELQSFSHSIEYYVETEGAPDPVTGLAGASTFEYYDVRITPVEPNSSTVTFTTGNPGVVSGYYRGVFNDQLTTMSSDGTVTTVTTLAEPQGSVFDKVNRDTLHEVISFKADLTRSRTFHYLAEALDEESVIASQTYTILAQDLSWTPGADSLTELVQYASSK